MFNSIIWATDGSAAADQAMPYVKSLASENHAEVVVLHADQLLMGRGGGQHVIADEEDVRTKIETQAKELSDAGITSTARVVIIAVGAGPAQTIAETAEELGSDLIVVGTRGHTTLGGLLLGSVTHRLLHIAPCPVLTVPSRSSDESAQAGASAAAEANS
jgi:nucleotide-binding universal stress UspA family protein